ncbi:MAG: branched-chain amino acid aminotransferase [Rhodospirillaceae bacterium]|nr:branched-chain amino acid aminotransferase [Rhodospirillaceae bacterium]MBT7294422.1 branched-chain amino acid aminotransferase [Rhodospirillaceae bacterium]
MADLIPFDDRDGVIWFDGEMVPWRDAKLHVLSHALHYASCVFEGERAYSGRIFKLSEHTERLFDSAAQLDMEIPYTPAEIDAACNELIKRQDIVDGYVRPVAWRGSEMMGVSAQVAKTHVAIATWPWPNLFGDDRLDSGIRMKTSKWRRPAPNTAPVKAKAAGLYMICTLSRHSVEPEGYDDALMLDWRGQVAESTGANIFLVIKGVIHTPTPDCFLDGITRRTVMDLARKRGHEVIERVIMPEDLGDADEVFLTGTAAEVTPVGEIDEHNYQVGPITRQLMDDYEAAVRMGD